MHTLYAAALHLLVTGLPWSGVAPEEPPAEDVKAGWTAFVVFLLLIVAVVILCLSLVKQLRKAQAAKDAGVYGDPPAPDPEDADPDAAEDPDTP